MFTAKNFPRDKDSKATQSTGYPEITLTFKCREDLDEWVKRTGAILFANAFYLEDGPIPDVKEVLGREVYILQGRLVAPAISPAATKREDPQINVCV